MKDIATENNLLYGSGIETAKGSQDTGHLIGKKLLNARLSITSFRVDTIHSEIFNKKKIHRSKEKIQEIFKPPYTLFRKGVDTKNYKLRAGYSEEELLYTDAVYGIVGEEETKNILLSFTGLLNSSFYAYLNLMLGSSIGIEREQAFPTQVMSFPAITDDVLAKKVIHIQDKLVQKEQGILNENVQNDIEVLIDELDYYILSVFDLQDNPFVDYVLNVQIPLLTGDKQIYRQVTVSALQKYIKPFLTYWDDVLKEDLFTQVTIYPNILNRFTAVEVTFLKHEPEEKMKIIEDRNEQFKLVSQFTLYKQNDLFYEMKDVINFEDDSFYILKSNEYKNWHPAISEIDLAKVIDAVFQGSGDSDGRI